MRKLGPAILLIIIFVLASMFAGCSLSGGASAEVRDILKKCVESSSGIQSYDAKIIKTKKFNEGASYEPVDEKVSMTLNCFLDPIKVKVVSQSASSDAVTFNSLRAYDKNELYVGFSDGSYYINLNGNTLPGSSTKDIGPGIVNENYMSQMQFFVGITSDVKIAGSETINGYNSYRITGLISVKNLDEIIHNFKNDLLDQHDELSILSKESLNRHNISEDISATYWIAKDTGYCTKIRIDASSALKALLEKNGVQTNETAEFLIDVEMMNFNKATYFDTPAF